MTDYGYNELNAVIDADGAILATVATMEEISASRTDNDVYMALLIRLAEAGGSDDHSGNSFGYVLRVAYRILRQGREGLS